jgi:hypothetical protein
MSPEVFSFLALELDFFPFELVFDFDDVLVVVLGLAATGLAAVVVFVLGLA